MNRAQSHDKPTYDDAIQFALNAKPLCATVSNAAGNLTPLVLCPKRDKGFPTFPPFLQLLSLNGPKIPQMVYSRRTHRIHKLERYANCEAALLTFAATFAYDVHHEAHTYSGSFVL